MAVGSGLPETIYTHSFSSPVGLLHAAVDRRGRVVHLGFRPLAAASVDSELEENKYACGELEYQLEEYFAGTRQEFSVDLKLEGTGFQKAVWSRLLKIRYGETASYGHVAQKIGRRDAARAVGNAVAANRIVIIVPCHRIVPASGGIGTYARRALEPEDGRRVKELLLELESRQTLLDMSVAQNRSSQS
jgi:methylated-DNA-[protein]-cysteine S-methyltransferase